MINGNNINGIRNLSNIGVAARLLTPLGFMQGRHGSCVFNNNSSVRNLGYTGVAAGLVTPIGSIHGVYRNFVMSNINISSVRNLGYRCGLLVWWHL